MSFGVKCHLTALFIHFLNDCSGIVWSISSGMWHLGFCCIQGMLRYRSDLLKTLGTLLFLPAFLTGAAEQKQMVEVELFSEYKDDPVRSRKYIQMSWRKTGRSITTLLCAFVCLCAVCSLSHSCYWDPFWQGPDLLVSSVYPCSFHRNKVTHSAFTHQHSFVL